MKIPDPMLSFIYGIFFVNLLIILNFYHILTRLIYGRKASAAECVWFKQVVIVRVMLTIESNT